MLAAVSANDIAVSGLRAQRVRMNLIANNIANAETTRTEHGGPFRRQMVMFRAQDLGPRLDPKDFGVEISRVAPDPSPFRQVYDPGHPDANEDGVVLFPNINLATEMVNLVSAQRAYEANIDVIVANRRMTEKALEIIQA